MNGKINIEKQKVGAQEWFSFVESHISFIRRYVQKLSCDQMKNDELQNAQKSIVDSFVLLRYVHMNYLSDTAAYMKQAEFTHNSITQELDVIEKMLGKVMNDKQLLYVCLDALDRLRSFYPRVFIDHNASPPWFSKG